MVAFFVFPEAIMEGLFARGAFDIEAARAASAVLVCYAAGLPGFVLLRTVTPLFHARGDTTMPVIATAISIVINLIVKVVLIFAFGFGVTGLALGTSVGVWINLVVLAAVAAARGLLVVDERLTHGGPRIVGAAFYSAAVVWLVSWPLAGELAGITFLRAEIYFVALGVLTLASYGVALLGFGWKR
jgi:putative peptidoglycan lipid II flippase